MGDHPRRALGTRGLAIRAGSRRPPRGEARGPRAQDKVVGRLSGVDAPAAIARCQAPFKNRVGSSGDAPLRISKCSCGALTLPVWPERAITWPRLTWSPRLTRRSLAWA